MARIFFQDRTCFGELGQLAASCCSLFGIPSAFPPRSYFLGPGHFLPAQDLSWGTLCPAFSIFLSLPLSQVSQASWSGSFFCRLLTLPIIFQRYDSEHISYFWHWLGIWFPEDQTNTGAYFPLPCKLMMNKTRHISHSVLLHDTLTIFPRKCFLKQLFVVPFIFACCCWGELLLEHVWHCYVLRRTLMVCFPLLSLCSFCSLFHEVYV